MMPIYHFNRKPYNSTQNNANMKHNNITFEPGRCTRKGKKFSMETNESCLKMVSISRMLF